MNWTSNENTNCYYFLQPLADQAVTIVKLLRETKTGLAIIAILLRHENTYYIKRIYDGSIVINDYEEFPQSICAIPTGAQSTAALLCKGDICLHNIVISRRALKVFDKDYFVNFCKQHDLPVPNTLNDLQDIPEDGFPIFYKQKYETGGGIRGICKLPLADKKRLERNVSGQGARVIKTSFEVPSQAVCKIACNLNC